MASYDVGSWFWNVVRRHGASLAVMLCLSLISPGCSSDEPESSAAGDSRQEEASLPLEPEFRSVLPAEAQMLLQDRPNLLVIDVRTLKEREEVRIPGSRPIPLSQLMGGEASVPDDRPLLLVCAVGGRSYAAGLYLVKKGVRQVYNLRGGLAAWEKDGLPVDRGKE